MGTRDRPCGVACAAPVLSLLAAVTVRSSIKLAVTELNGNESSYFIRTP